MNFRRAFPVYRQFEAIDCGPACLRMIAKHYGKSYSIEYLRDICFVTKEGASLLDLQSASQSIGLLARSVLASYAYLAEEAKLPCIAHWDDNHFIVVYRADDRHVWIADPAHGRAQYSIDDFISHWSASGDEGYLLLVCPGDEFLSRQEPVRTRRSFFSLFSYWRAYKQLIGQLLLAMALGAAIQFVLPFLTQLIVDRGIQSQSLTFLQLVLFGQLVLIASRIFVAYLRSWLVFYISTPINVTLVFDFLVKLTKLPLRYFDVTTLGDSLQRIGDHQRVEYFLTHSVLNAFLTVISLVVFGIVLATYNLPIFLVFAAGTLFYGLWMRLFFHRRRELDGVRFRQQARNQNVILQLMMGMQEIRLADNSRRRLREWSAGQSQLFFTGRRELALWLNQKSGCTFIQESQNILITFLAARSVIYGEITLGMMLAIQFIIGQLTGPVEEMVEFVTASQEAKLSFERLQTVHSLPDEENKKDAKVSAIPPAADIVLSGVTFQYGGPHSDEALRDVSLILPGKSVTAIVGASGSGKTTLLKLLLGVYQPVRGTITVGGLRLGDLSLDTWRRTCGLVMQDGYIFSDTIADNIALGDGAVDDHRLRAAASTANIHEFIESLPLGYKTRIGAQGHGLSEGQKQRILIARAVYKDPDYFFFDEATNALDSTNEAEIMMKLARCFSDRTVVVAAHRLSTVRHADQIVVLDRGGVVEIGNHAGLMERRGAYHDLVKDQLS